MTAGGTPRRTAHVDSGAAAAMTDIVWMVEAYPGVGQPMGSVLSMAISKSPLVASRKSPPEGRSQAFVDGPPALVRASFIR
jgi:hypothetical protein